MAIPFEERKRNLDNKNNQRKLIEFLWLLHCDKRMLNEYFSDFDCIFRLSLASRRQMTTSARVNYLPIVE